MIDLISIGGGLAGTCAALRARQLGGSALVLEQGQDIAYLCNTRYANTVLHVGYRDPRSPPAELRQALDTLSGGWAAPKLLELLANNASRAIDWLEGIGVNIKAGDGYRSRMATPTRPDVPGLVWRDVGGDALLSLIERQLLEVGVAISRGHRCTALARTEGGWLVHAQTSEGLREFCSRNVVLADGGFQGSQELLRRHVCEFPERLFVRGTSVSKGDALQMSIKAGGATVGLEYFYGHLLSNESFTNDKLWPMPWLDRLVEAGILVDSRGMRFVEEGRGGIVVANAAARHAHNDRLFTLFDSEIWESIGGNAAVGRVPPNPHLPAAGATLHSASTLEALAEQIGLPSSALQKTVAERNMRLESSPPATTSKGVQPRRVAVAPYFAIGTAVGITNTTGGIRVDANCQVVRAEGTGTIEGLYAAGTAAGGFDGGPRAAYTGGLVRTAVTAITAAEHALSRARPETN